MIPRIVHQTARTAAVSWEERRLHNRMRAIQPNWTFCFWDDGGNRRLFSSVFPQFLDRYDRISRGVVKADISRYIYLYVFGGVYMDTDYKIFRAIDECQLANACTIPIEIGSFDNVDSVRLGNSLLASEPGHPFWHRLISHVFEHNHPDDDGCHGVVSVAGPRAITRFIVEDPERAFGIHFAEPIVFHPEQLGLSPRVAARSLASYGTHLCWGSWRDKPLAQRLRNAARRKLSAL